MNMVQTLCSLDSSEGCLLSMFVWVGIYLGWTHCKLFSDRSSNLSSVTLSLAGICSMHSLHSPPLWFSFLKFSPHFPATVIIPNSVLWFLEPERLWISYSVFSSNAQRWLQPTLRLRDIKGGKVPFISSKCWLLSLYNSFSSFSSTFSFFVHFPPPEFIVAVFGKAGSSSCFLSHIKCGLD